MNASAEDLRYPSIEPYDSGYLNIGMHEIYYEQCGNPNGYPIMFVHGGPGAGCTTDDRRFFNPGLWRIILFDQRGSGRSHPFGCIENNETFDLVSDINALTKMLSIKKMVLFGGSWGTTLSLAYAIENPKMVSGMILRGIWLADKKELDYYARGGVISHFPESWARFIKNVPNSYRQDPFVYYYKVMTGDSHDMQKLYAYELARYEFSISFLDERSAEEIDNIIKSYPFVSLGIMEAHYIVNNCFIAENYILKNARKIRKIPTSIIHGRYDCVCQPLDAFALHEALPLSTLRMTLAGHAGSEPENRAALIEETNKMFNRVCRNGH